jgi:putative tricarboxylic transport membrane protein
MAKSRQVSAESILNIILIILGIWIIYESFQMGFGSLKRPGSGLFTIVCGFLLLALNGALLIKKSGARIQSVFQAGEGRKFLAIACPFFAWILMIDLLGYVLVTFLGTLCLSKILNLPGWRKPLLLSLGTAFCCFVLFDYLLYLDLPRGFFG